MDAEGVRQLKVRNTDDDMVPLGAVVDVQDSTGPVQVVRYNMFPAATITGAALPGVSKVFQLIPVNYFLHCTVLYSGD
jgi:multidrug efflux pump